MNREATMLFTCPNPTPPSYARTASRYSLIILNDKWNIYQFKIDERVAARSPTTASLSLLTTFGTKVGEREKGGGRRRAAQHIHLIEDVTKR